MANIHTIAKVSRALQFFSWIGLVGVPITIGSIWLFGSEALLLSREATEYLIPHGASFEVGLLDPTMRFTGLLISLIPGGIMMLGLWHLARLFARFAMLEFFTLDTVRHFRVFATTVVLTGISMPVASALLSFATSSSNPPGQRFISITAGDTELTSIFLGCVMLVIAWVMEQGKQLNDDYQGIV